MQLQYTYDASDERVIKTAVDVLGNKLFTAYIFGSLELRRAAESGTNDYTRSTATEVPYLTAHGVRLARVHYAEELIPAPIGQSLHVLLEMPDHLGSTSIVVDQASSELVERGTFMAYGQADSDYRPTRWGSFREDYRFTGKEEDVEVGLQYFGKRYYAPGLNRWVSADPLTVHELGADPNPYAYVHGSILRATDPLGLEDDKPTAAPAPGASQGQGSPVPSRAAPSGLQGARAVAGFFLNRAWEWIRGPLTPEGGVSQIAEAVGTRIEHGVDQAIADPKGFVGGMADKADTVVQVATAAAMVAEAVSGGPPIPPMTAPSLASAGAAGSVAASPQAALVPPVLLAGKQAAGGNEGGSGQNATEGGGASGTGVQQVNGRSPINSRYAGGTHPSGVKFNEQGFPDFSPWTKATVKLEGLTGDYAKDAAMANKAVRLETTPEGYVWHHVEDGRTMQLVQQDIHQAVRHTGGAALIRGGGP